MHDYFPNEMTWRVPRAQRSFRIWLVEPSNYDPKRHAAIFDAAITRLLNSPLEEADAATAASRSHAVVEPFDLVTFPEAFLPAPDLIRFLQSLAHGPEIGCVHVGLRPDDSTDHLFSWAQASDLAASVHSLPATVPGDLTSFDAWLKRSHGLSGGVNLACVAVRDADGHVRVCLYPKVVRAQVEVSAIAEQHMREGDMLTVLTLIPTRKDLNRVTLQPLTCADALDLPRDRHEGPLAAVSSGNSLSNPPNHVDVVSVAVCSPQKIAGRQRQRTWQPDFLTTFAHCASDESFRRHHRAVFALANFRRSPRGEEAGLSGVFIPLPRAQHQLPDYVRVHSFARATPAAPYEWHDREYKGHSRRGHLLSLDRKDATATLLGLTLDVLPDDASLGRRVQGAHSFRLHIGRGDPLSFDEVKP